MLHFIVLNQSLKRQILNTAHFRMIICYNCKTLIEYVWDKLDY